MLHADVMPEVQQQVLRSLGPFTATNGFYLAGGTAVALHLGHRRSVDLDWFTGSDFRNPRRLAADVQEAAADFAIEDLARGTLHGFTHGVKVSFFEYKYPMLAEPRKWPEFDCRLAGPEDLACMKLSAISSRGERKDFIDVYALGQEGFSLDDMLTWYRSKFPDTQNVVHVLKSLTYFDDAEQDDMPHMYWDLEWEQVRRTLEGWVRDYTRRHPRRRGGRGPR